MNYREACELEAAYEAVERLAEFASEQASDANAYKQGMLNNFKTAMRFLEELEDATTTPDDSDEVVMWRGLCHSRAVQLNEAYNTISELRDEVKSLLETIDDLIVGGEK